MLVDSLVLSHFQYALPVWGPPLPQGSINRLQKLQNWGVRIAQSLRKYDHVSHHLRLLSWLPITQQIQYRSNCAMYHHYTNNSIPLIPPLCFGRQHTRNTRCSANFANISRCRLSSTQRFFRYNGTKWWNMLPDTIVSLSYGEFAPAVYIYQHLMKEDG